MVWGLFYKRMVLKLSNFSLFTNDYVLIHLPLWNGKFLKLTMPQFYPFLYKVVLAIFNFSKDKVSF